MSGRRSGTIRLVRRSLIALAWLVASAAVPAQTAAPAAAKPSAHVQKDIERHRAMALAHENAARCLESGKPEAECQERLRAECKGLAVGRYCGMRHEH
jgi:hypothetical protein